MIDQRLDREGARSADAVDLETGLIAVKRALNEMHVQLAVEGFDEVGTEVLGDDVVVVTRRCAARQRSVVSVAHMAFHRHDAGAATWRVNVPGLVDEVRLESSVAGWSTDYDDHDQLIVGLTDYRVEMCRGVSVSDSRLVRVLPRKDQAMCDSVELVNFAPGCAVVLSVTLSSDCLLYTSPSPRCLLYTSPSPRDRTRSRMPSSA